MNSVFLVVSICMGLYAAQGLTSKPQAVLPAAPTVAIHSAAIEGNETEQFQGVIVSKNGEIFVLRDDVNNTWYHLDDQEAAGKHLGKKVLVTGNLDTRTDVIRVQSISETT
ncbi:MAG TPA: DUF5818 domain-containing protein [Candidatus Acidoferrales bacterium]|nr:DUF5818 domain-containing protein [Candidatus Acidoferrales bacterium]